MTNRFEHDVDRLAQEVIDANPGSAVTAAYRAVAIGLFSKAGAVSASPQPRCPKCNHREISFWGAPDSRFSRFINCHSCKTQFAIGDMTLEEMAQFFAAAPAQEPDRKMLEAIAEDGLLVTWDKDFKFNFSQVVRLMAEFVIEHPWADAAQEQPVENSPQLDDSRCAICGWPLAETAEKGCVRGNCSMRPFPDNIYDPARANKEYKTERFTNSPQKGKP